MRYGLNLASRHTAHALVLELVGSGKEVLEVGCASGYLSRLFREKGCTVVGIEVDPEAAAVARSFCDEVLCGSVEDEELLSRVQRCFDVVVLADVLEHLTEPTAVLVRLRRFFRKNGYAVISVPNVANWRVRGQLLLGRFDYQEAGILDRTHYRFFTKRTAEAMIREAGYEIQGFFPGATRMPKVLVDLVPTFFAVHLVFRAKPTLRDGP